LSRDRQSADAWGAPAQWEHADERAVRKVLDGIDGAWDRAAQGAREAREHDTLTLDDL
jgi:hypothetical protein